MYASRLAEHKFGLSQDFDGIGETLKFSTSTFGLSQGFGFGSAYGFPNAAGDDYRNSLTDTSSPLGNAVVGGSVSGSLEAYFDRDLFAVSFTAGQTYTIDLRATSSGVDPYLRLLNSAGSQLALNDDFGGSTNSRITFTATQTGTFYLEARDYGYGRGGYTLAVSGSGGTTPTPTDDFRDSIGDTTAPFGQVAVGGSTNGRIEVGGDTDIFSISLQAGQSYTFKLNGATGGLSDPSLKLLGSNGAQLATNNDFGGTKNSQITFTASTTGTYYLEAAGASSSLTGAYSVSAAQNSTPPAGGSFDIKVNFTGDQQYAAIFEQAAARWEQVITADVPDFRSSRYGLIDDLLIDASAVYIDGPSNILGRAGPDEFRSGSYLPSHGIMEFDSADLATMAANGTLLGVIIHEMGHVLGLGTLWDTKGLKSGNFSYTGANALAEYRTLSGNANATSIPLETTGGQGTAGSHWSESVFSSELMTGYASGGMQLSRMTVGALADLGYGVNYAAADAYTLPNRVNALLSADGVAQMDEIFGIV